MTYSEEINMNEAPDVFALWRMLDHTRFMISRCRQQELANYGVTSVQAYVLFILSSRGEAVSINEIVRLTQRKHHTISTLLARMERHELVNRMRDPHDARRWDVSITEEGAQLFTRITRDSIESIFAGLKTSERIELKRALGSLLVAAYEAAGEPVPASFTDFSVEQ